MDSDEPIDWMKYLFAEALEGFEIYRKDNDTIGVRPVWYDAEKNPPPPFQDVHLLVDGRVIIGWNESTGEREDPSYCCYGAWPGAFLSGERVTHWAPLLEPPDPDLDKDPKPRIIIDGRKPSEDQS